MEKNITILIDGLAEKGWAAVPDYWDAGLTARLLAELEAQDAQNGLTAAGIGKTGGLAADIRTDRTRWLSPADPAAAEFLAGAETLRQALNQALFLGLFDYEAHYAVYQAGGFYKKHLDALRGQKNRVVSTVTYLTPGWTGADGGHLVLYGPQDQDQEIARILPQAGTMAVFLSEELPHEVLPPARPRASIAGWFRCNPSASGRVDPSR